MKYIVTGVLFIFGKLVSCSEIIPVSSVKGDSLDLSCTSKGNKWVYACFVNSSVGQHYGLGTHGSTWENGRIRSISNSNSSCGLVIQTVKKQDEGIWSCTLRIPTVIPIKYPLETRTEITRFRITVKGPGSQLNTSTYHEREVHEISTKSAYDEGTTIFPLINSRNLVVFSSTPSVEIKKLESGLNLSTPLSIKYVDDSKTTNNSPENNITMIEKRGSDIITHKIGAVYYIPLICATVFSIFCSVIFIVKAVIKCQNM